MRQQIHEFMRRLDGRLVVLWRAHHDTGRVEIVGQRVPLAKELGGEENMVVMQGVAQLLRVTNRNG